MSRIDGVISTRAPFVNQEQLRIRNTESKPAFENDDAVKITLERRPAPAAERANEIARAAVNPAGNTRGWARIRPQPMPPVGEPPQVPPRIQPMPMPQPIIQPEPQPVAITTRAENQGAEISMDRTRAVAQPEAADAGFGRAENAAPILTRRA